MNGKQAKAARAAAKKGGLPPLVYVGDKPPVFETIKDPAGVEHFVKVRRGVPRVLGACERKLYQMAKAEYKKGVRKSLSIIQCGA